MGFGDYDRFQTEQRRTRDAQLTGTAAPTAPVVSSETPAAGNTVNAAVSEAAATATATPTTPTAPARQPTSTASISDEQDFSAVAERESIESDAARIAQNRAQYQQVQPGAAPRRTGDSEPNIVRYALQTNNVVGQKLYRRFGIYTRAKYEAACAKYFSPDRAQEDFLRAGGPGRDRFGLDPDGDGFACDWNPAKLRAAARSG